VFHAVCLSVRPSVHPPTCVRVNSINSKSETCRKIKFREGSTLETTGWIKSVSDDENMKENVKDLFMYTSGIVYYTI